MDDPIERIDGLLASNEHRAAWAQMIQLLEREPTSAACQAIADVASRLNAKAADLVPVRVSLLANFTADLVAPVLVAHALSSRLLIDPYVAGYDTWIQEILDPSSGLRKRDTDVVVLALQLEAFSPALVSGFLELTAEQATAEVDAVADRIENAVSALRAWSRAKLLIHTFPPPTLPALGILDVRLPIGQTAMVRRLNDRLARFAERQSDVYLIDLARLIASVGASRWQDARLWAMAKIPFSQAAVYALAGEYVRYLRAFKGLARKVLVVDLDDTLWGGILGEDGADGIRLGDQYPGSAFVDVQRAILGLHRRGVVLAINSKNNAEEVLDVLEKHSGMVLRPQHFAAMRINWQDKSTNMVEIADELGLSLDSFVFVDDSAVECERIRQALPEVLTVRLAGEPALRPGAILGLGAFDTLSYSEEDRQRGVLYRQEAERTRLRAGAQSLEDFYRSLDMELTVEQVGRAQLQRAADLTQRTNQFNLTTRRYTVDDLASALREPGCEGYTFRLKDRFGDNGIIGLAILEGAGPRLCISSLLLSCRVLRRTVEDAVLAFLLTRARERGASEVEGRYCPTRKNGQASGFYRERGFEPIESDGDTERFIRHVGVPIDSPAWIAVTHHVAAETV
jgi:FkbH-like protein